MYWCIKEISEQKICGKIQNNKESFKGIISLVFTGIIGAFVPIIRHYYRRIFLKK